MRRGARSLPVLGIRFLYIVASVLVAIAAVPTIAGLDDSGHPGAQLLAVAALALQLALLGLAWRVIAVAAIGPDTPSWRTFTLGWLVRYIPGPCTLPASKAVELQRAGHTARTIASAVGTEQVLQALACVVLPLVLAPAYVDGVAGWAMLAAGCLLAATTILLPGSEYGKRIAHRVPSKLRAPLVPRREMLLAFLSLSVAGLASAAAFSIIVTVVSGSAAPHSATSLFIFAAAGLAGFVAPLVPAGAGAREGSIVVLLSPMTGPADALEAAILIRGLSVLVDAGLGVLLVGMTIGHRHFAVRRGYPLFRLSAAKKRA